MKNPKGLEAFNSFYLNIYGDRWTQLKTALEAPKIHLALSPDGSILKPRESFQKPTILDNGLKSYYLMDPASFHAAKILADKPGDSILDMCAAPGGKTLVLGLLSPTFDFFVANERSANRRNRLIKTINDYFNNEIKEKIIVKGYDATRWCLYEKEAYDKILLDVPRSSERHLLEKKNLLKEWKPSRSKKLAKTQWTLLAGAYEVLKPNGHLLYSTCSISPLENDEVIAKLLNKFPTAEIVPCHQGEKTTHGQIFLPDNSGFGPLYFSLIKKPEFNSGL